MLLSKLLMLDPAPERVMGVVIDVDDVTIPKGLKEVSFLAPPCPDGIDDRLLDIAIAYLIAPASERVDTIIEIPAENEITHPKNIWNTANQSELSIALLPPVTDDDEAFEAYVQRLETFVPLFCNQPRYSRAAMPITNYLQYLMVELLDKEKAATFAPTDDYVIERFASVMSTSRADAMKERMRQAFYAVYGGEQQFSDHYLDIMRGIYEASEQYVIDRKAALEAFQVEEAEKIVEATAEDAMRDFMGWLPDTPIVDHSQMPRFRKAIMTALAKHFVRSEEQVAPAFTTQIEERVLRLVVEDIQSAMAGTLPAVDDAKTSGARNYRLVLQAIVASLWSDPAEPVGLTDVGATEKIIDEIIAGNPDQVAKVQAKPTMIGWFVGQAMKATGGKVNPDAVNEMMKKKLGLE